MQWLLCKKEWIYYNKITLFNRLSPHIMHESTMKNTFLNTSYLLLPWNLLSNAITAIIILVIHKHETHSWYMLWYWGSLNKIYARSRNLHLAIYSIKGSHVWIIHYWQQVNWTSLICIQWAKLTGWYCEAVHQHTFSKCIHYNFLYLNSTDVHLLQP